MSTGAIHVEIHGQKYAVRSDLDPQYVAELAAFLDEKMRAASRELTAAEPLRVAVIAALNISDELFRTRAVADGKDSAVRARTAELERMLDAVLEGAPQTVVDP